MSKNKSIFLDIYRSKKIKKAFSRNDCKGGFESENIQLYP